MVSHCACPTSTRFIVRVARAQEIVRLHPLLCSKHLQKGAVEVALYCAHRATTALSWGLCEHEGHLTAPDLPLLTSSPRKRMLLRDPARNALLSELSAKRRISPRRSDHERATS